MGASSAISRKISGASSKIKAMMRASIMSGDWLPDRRVPSERQLVELYGVSKMTADRALRELSEEGLLIRVRGRGSFVARPKNCTGEIKILDVAAEIRARGYRHSSDVVALTTLPLDASEAELFGVAEGTLAVRVLLLHSADGTPWRLEERLVPSTLAPAFLDQSFVATTPHAYLASVYPEAEYDCSIEAVMPRDWEAKLLLMFPRQPCLCLHGRMTSSDRVVSIVRLSGGANVRGSHSPKPDPARRSSACRRGISARETSAANFDACKEKSMRYF